jgi:hypothetical protein
MAQVCASCPTTKLTCRYEAQRNSGRVSKIPRSAKRPRSETERGWRGSALLGFVIMLHSYDYISLFVPFINIPVGLGNLFKRIVFVYDCFYLSRLQKLFDIGCCTIVFLLFRYLLHPSLNNAGVDKIPAKLFL